MSTPARPTREQRQEETRRALLDAARTVIAERGISAASHREIGRTAGLTTGAIFANFANKADLVLSVLEDAATTGTVLAADCASVAGCLADLGRRLALQADLEPELTLLSMEFALAAIRDPAVRDRRLPQRQAEHAGYARLLSDLAARSGEALPLPAEEFVEVVMNLGWALLCTRTMLGPETISEEFMVRALTLLLPGA